MFGFGKIKKSQSKTWSSTYRSAYSKDNVWLASQLDRRIKIYESIQTEASDGGFEQTYNELKELWARVTTVSHNSYVRWSSVEGIGNLSHEIVIRKSSLDDLNISFSSAFTTGFDNIDDLNPAKSTMFVKLLTRETPGKFFKIRRIMNMDENDEYLSMLCEEIEEFGTGAPNVDEEGLS